MSCKTCGTIPHHNECPVPFYEDRERWERRSGHRDHFRAVRARDKDVCQLCGKRIRDYYDMTLDHVLARALGGTNEPDNLQLAHRACNAKKHRDIEQPEIQKRKSGRT